MPQPLSTFLKTGNYSLQFNADALRDKPDFAALIAEAIARWARIEAGVGNIFVEMLGSEINAGYAMFSALRATTLQFQVIKSTANSVLTGEALEVFSATMGVVESVQPERNRLAHWLWGSSPQVPEGLLLIDPVYARDMNVRREKYQREFIKEMKLKVTVEEHMSFFKYDLSKIFVYRKSDLERINRDVLEVENIVGLATTYFDDGGALPSLFSAQTIPGWHPRWPLPTRDKLFAQLCALRPFAEALRQIRAKKIPEAQS